MDFKRQIEYAEMIADHPITGENNLANPYSKASCLILYLYSMEFGEPPLYAEVNRCCRTMDESELDHLGPFICAFSEVVKTAEVQKEVTDRIPSGESKYKAMKNEGQYLNLDGTFLLYIGAQIESSQIDLWEEA